MKSSRDVHTPHVMPGAHDEVDSAERQADRVCTHTQLSKEFADRIVYECVMGDNPDELKWQPVCL